MKCGDYVSTWAIAGATEFTAIAKVLRVIPDSAPARDSQDYLFEVQVGKRKFLHRRSELRPLSGQLLKGEVIDDNRNPTTLIGFGHQKLGS